MNTQWSIAAGCCLACALSASPASFYPQRLDDAKAVYLSPSTNGDDTAGLQAAVNRVQETTGQGLVLLAPGRYTLTNTIYIWPGIRLIGYGAERPALVLPAHAPGFGDAAQEKLLIFFAGGRARHSPDGRAVPDANPGTFYSALANIDVEIGGGNSGAVAVRSHYAQHCFLAHMDLHLGPALAGVHEGGNVIEDVHFFGGAHGIWTAKPSPGWQLTVMDSSFEGQREAAILEHEAGLTLIRPQFRHVPAAVEIEPDWADELWVQDARLEDVSGPAFVYGLEKSPRTQINLTGLTCRNVPVFAVARDSGERFAAPGASYAVKTFSHGLSYADIGETPEIKTVFDAVKLAAMPPPAASDLPPLPAADSWVNLRDLGAKGDGATDDTEALQTAIEKHRAIYLPSGVYVTHDTLKLKPDTVLIGLHPGATQIILPDGTSAYQGVGAPKALLEAPKGGSNIVMGIGLYTGGNNRRAVGALWKAGAGSLMNDVRFLGGHGTPLPDGSRQNPYNSNHTGDPDPNRRWDSQYPSLWVTDGGGGVFLDIWTPSTFAQAGMVVSDTQTKGCAYEISSEHHVRHELQVRHAAHWSFYALQTEEERGESGFALPIEIESSEDILVANFHSYRVISSYQPFPWAVKVSNSRDIRFRNFHCDSNSKASFDDAIYDQTHGLDIRQHEFASLDISGAAPAVRTPAVSPVVEAGATLRKLAGGFFNISGGAAGPEGDFYFVDAHWQRIYRWRAASQQLATVCDSPLDPVNLAVDRSGNLIVVSYAGDGVVYAAATNGDILRLPPEPVAEAAGQDLYLPNSDWQLNEQSLSHPAAAFVSPDKSARLVAGRDFLDGATSWGVKSSPPLRSFGLARAVPGRPFYVTDESALRTWAADVSADGSLGHFRLFAEQGGESVVSDADGNVYIAAGQVYVYDRQGRLVDTLEVPERPVQLAFGGADHQTLFICARSSLYAVRTRVGGW